MAIAHAIKIGAEPKKLYQDIVDWAVDIEVAPALMDAIIGTSDAPPREYIQHQGGVLIAFHNALRQLLHARNLETSVVDTDTNAAICGGALRCCVRSRRHTRSMGQPCTELQTQGRTSRCSSSTTRMLLVGGCT